MLVWLTQSTDASVANAENISMGPGVQFAKLKRCRRGAIERLNGYDHNAVHTKDHIMLR